jgi:predicted nucleotidyltransferase
LSDGVARLEAFAERAAEAMRGDERIVAAWLGGSLAAGTADGYSDVDLRVAVLDEAFDAVVADWPALPDRIAPTVLRRKIGPPDSPIVTAITPEWLRFDVAIARASAPERAGDRLLFDRRAAPPEPGAPVPRPDPAARLPGLVEEFLRVLGLLRVVAGRDEPVLAAHGAGMLRWSLVELFLLENRAQRGGMLHLTRYLTAEQRALLEELPPTPLAMNAALARAFLPRARRLMAAHGQPYPEDLERATRAYLAGLVEI